MLTSTESTLFYSVMVHSLALRSSFYLFISSLVACGFGLELLTLTEKVPGPGRTPKLMPGTQGSVGENQTAGSVIIVWPCGMTTSFGLTSAVLTLSMSTFAKGGHKGVIGLVDLDYGYV